MRILDDDLAYSVYVMEYAYYIQNQGGSLVKTLRLVLGDEIGFYSVICLDMMRMPE